MEMINAKCKMYVRVCVCVCVCRWRRDLRGKRIEQQMRVSIKQLIEQPRRGIERDQRLVNGLQQRQRIGLDLAVMCVLMCRHVEHADTHDGV
jgi:hypothetical protein